MTELEAGGTPGVYIASSEFAEAARAQGQALGFHPASVFVAHPIQDRTDQEVRALAEAAFAEVVQALAG